MRQDNAGESVEQQLAGMDDDIAACRAWGHDWPSKRMRPGKPLPRNLSPRLVEDGYIEVTEECLNGCGKKRMWTLFPGGIYDMDCKRTYKDPRHWPVLHKDQNIGRRDIQAETVRRNSERILAAAQRAQAAEARAAQAVPAARFTAPPRQGKEEE